MKFNRLSIIIEKPVNQVYQFCITPPNSTKWIPGVVKEETSEWPVKVGTIYSLTNDKNELSKVAVTAIKENEYVEWESADTNYLCRYTLKKISKDSCELEYSEWVKDGQIDEPFTHSILKKLKAVIELIA